MRKDRGRSPRAYAWLPSATSGVEMGRGVPGAQKGPGSIDREVHRFNWVFFSIDLID